MGAGAEANQRREAEGIEEAGEEAEAPGGMNSGHLSVVDLGDCQAREQFGAKLAAERSLGDEIVTGSRPAILLGLPAHHVGNPVPRHPDFVISRHLWAPVSV